MKLNLRLVPAGKAGVADPAFVRINTFNPAVAQYGLRRNDLVVISGPQGTICRYVLLGSKVKQNELGIDWDSRTAIADNRAEECEVEIRPATKRDWLHLQFDPPTVRERDATLFAVALSTASALLGAVIGFILGIMA